MNAKTIAQIFGGVVLALGVIGLFAGEQRLWGIMNANLTLDFTRILLGGFLLYASMRSDELTRTALNVFGAVYLLNFLIAIISPTMYGMLPDGYGVFDNILHLSTGVIALIAAGMLPSGRQAHHT